MLIEISTKIYILHIKLIGSTKLIVKRFKGHASENQNEDLICSNVRFRNFSVSDNLRYFRGRFF